MREREKESARERERDQETKRASEREIACERERARENLVVQGVRGREGTVAMQVLL